MISGVQGTFGFLEHEDVADDDLGFFDWVDSDDWASADLFAEAEVDF